MLITIHHQLNACPHKLTGGGWREREHTKQRGKRRMKREPTFQLQQSQCGVDSFLCGVGEKCFSHIFQLFLFLEINAAQE